MAELTITQKRQLEGALRDIDSACQKLVYVFGYADSVEKVEPLQALAKELRALDGSVEIRVTGKGRKAKSDDPVQSDDPRTPEEKAADEADIKAASDAAVKSLVAPPEAS